VLLVGIWRFGNKTFIEKAELFAHSILEFIYKCLDKCCVLFLWFHLQEYRRVI